MKISQIRAYAVKVGIRNQLLVKVETDEGVFGWGESGLSGREKAVGEFHREAQHRGRMMYPSVSKRRTVSPCQDIPTSRPRREIGSPV